MELPRWRGVLESASRWRGMSNCYVPTSRKMELTHFREEDCTWAENSSLQPVVSLTSPWQTHGFQRLPLSSGRRWVQCETRRSLAMQHFANSHVAYPVTREFSVEGSELLALCLSVLSYTAPTRGIHKVTMSICWATLVNSFHLLTAG